MKSSSLRCNHSSEWSRKALQSHQVNYVHRCSGSATDSPFVHCNNCGNESACLLCERKGIITFYAGWSNRVSEYQIPWYVDIEAPLVWITWWYWCYCGTNYRGISLIWGRHCLPSSILHSREEQRRCNKVNSPALIITTSERWCLWLTYDYVTRAISSRIASAHVPVLSWATRGCILTWNSNQRRVVSTRDWQ